MDENITDKSHSIFLYIYYSKILKFFKFPIMALQSGNQKMYIYVNMKIDKHILKNKS